MNFLVADDHPMHRKGVISLLQSLQIADKFLEAGNGKEVLQLVADNHVDLFILDYKMPEYDGYLLTEKLIARDPKTKIIVISMFDSDTMIASLYWVGVKGFLSKGCDSSEIEKAITCILNGFTYFPDNFSEQKFNRFLAKQQKAILPRFTAHEKDIVRLISQGKTSSQIASYFGLTVNTIETYRVRLIEKAGVKNTSELVNFFHRNGVF